MEVHIVQQEPGYLFIDLERELSEDTEDTSDKVEAAVELFLLGVLQTCTRRILYERLLERSTIR